jgi:hypothetical protein
MKKLILVGLVLALVFSVVPAMAATNGTASDNTPVALQAMSNLSTVTPMTDTQLASVEGAAVNVRVQIAVAPQVNVCAVTRICIQLNIANIIQIQ